MKEYSGMLPPLLHRILCTICRPKMFVLSLLAVALWAGCDGDDDSPKVKCTGSTALFKKQCVDVGDIVTFGTYPQSTSTPEALQWRVLDIDSANRKLLLLSEYVIDAKPYNTEFISITWEKCTLRTWLNDTFKTAAFTSSEQKQIALTPLENPDNPSYGTDGGNATNDYVFLLSLADALSQTDDVAGSGKYFRSDAERQADATRYAVQNGAHVYGSESGNRANDATCTDVHCFAYWWLRSPGLSSTYAANVDLGGDVCINNESGCVDNTDMGVRPALWVKY